MEEIENFQDYLNGAMVKLMGIWNEVGLRGEDIDVRRFTVVAHLKNLVDEMLKEEEATRANLFKNVTILQAELSKLCTELKLPSYQPDEDFTPLQKENTLKVKVEQLVKEKMMRLDCYTKLNKTDKKLCSELCSIPYYIPSGAIPTEVQLEELDKHVKKLETEKNSRVKVFRETREQIIRLIEDLGVELVGNFEHDVIMEDEEVFHFSPENMKNLKAFHEKLLKREDENKEIAEKLLGELQALWEQLSVSQETRDCFLASNQGIKQKTIMAMREEVNRCKILKIQNASIIVAGLKQQLDSIWDKCYIPNQHRLRFMSSHSDSFNEELIVKHEEELRRMKDYYSEHKHLIKKIKHWESTYVKYLDFEKKASDPNRLFDKNWSLLKEEKERKIIMKELPRVEADVQDEIQAWEQTTGRTFLVRGRTFTDYIKMQWEDYSIQKENEKHLRHQSKQKRTEEEMLYGSKPNIVTPVKKPHLTPGSQQKQSHKTIRGTPMSQRNLMPLLEAKQPILDLNQESCSETFLMSQTMVGSSEIHRINPETTIAPIEHYSDFEIKLNENVRSNTRSSILTRELDFDDD